MKSSKRDDFPFKIVNALKHRAAFICSNPECKCLTLAPADIDDEKILFSGVASHICAASIGGPRYKASMTQEERSGINNAIFLCSNCSVIIDKNNGADFSEDDLRKWKSDHEAWVKENLNKKLVAAQEQKLETIFNVTSNNQSGGITAGIVQFGETQRTLTEELSAEIDSMFTDNTESISISYVSGNGEALNFAKQIQGYFISKGFKKIGMGSFTRTPEVYGILVEKSLHGGRQIWIGYKK